MNDKRLDQTFQKKVDHVQKHNGIHVFWDKEGVWKKIQKALEDTSSGPKMIAWYTVMAASVSLLVASAVNFVNYDLDLLQTSEPEVITESGSLDFERTSSPATSFYTSLPADSMVIPVRSRQVQSLATSSNTKAIEQLPVRQSQLQNFKRMSTSRLMKSNFNPKVKFHLSGGISGNSRFISPRVDLGVKISLTRSSDVKKSLFVGSSIQLMNAINAEQKSSRQLSKGYFLKSAYENERVKNGKLRTWSTGVEYLIHSDDDSLPGNTLKIFYNRSIYGRLKVGPEIMFTKNFKKIYPGITLALG